MLNLLTTFVLVMLGLYLLITIIVIVESAIYMLILKKQNKNKKVFIFPKELFEFEYPDTKLFKFWKEQFEMKKLEEYSKPLP